MKYYTYIHASPDGSVFYVGKGSGRRVFSMRDRSWEWHEEMQRHDGLLMKIVKRFDSEDDAFLHEQKLISEYRAKGVTLVNKSNGGSGPFGYKASDSRKKHLSNLLTGFVHKNVTCPHCKKTGGQTAMKRWHFENCTGLHGDHKVRTSINGRRIYLGQAKTKNDAKILSNEFKELATELMHGEFANTMSYATA